MVAVDFGISAKFISVRGNYSAEIFAIYLWEILSYVHPICKATYLLFQTFLAVNRISLDNRMGIKEKCH